ncbi:MAG: SpoIIE family protein phosphatase [Thermoleophilia bacterium]|nr:SpoIIE family protein phosphatase [Thermoleophilia bacterium]
MARSAELFPAAPAATATATGALEALADVALAVAAGQPLEPVLARLASAAASATGADVVVVRTSDPFGEGLVARAVFAPSAVIGAELEATRLAVRDVPADELERSTDDEGGLPRALGRAASLCGASVVRVCPVHRGGEPVATVELYRAGQHFAPAERAASRIAAAEVAVALELASSAGAVERAGDDRRVSLDLVGDLLAAGSDEGDLAEQIVRFAAEATGARRTLLWRIEGDAAPAFLAAHGYEPGAPNLDAAGQEVRTAIERRDASTNGDAPAGSPGGTSLVLPLGEPPAGALQLELGEGAPAIEPALLAGFAARVAVALRRARRAQLLATGLRRSQTIVAVISQAIARLSLSHTLETAVERISELTASAHVAIYLREDGRLSAAAARGLGGSHTELAERLLELALGPFRGRGYLFISDLRRDPRLGGLEHVLEETGVRRALLVPLVVHEDVIGTLAVYKTRPRPYREGEEGLLIALSSQLAVAVQNARLHERTKDLGAVLERTLASERKVARQLRGMFEISHSFARSLSLDATLAAVAETMVGLLGIDAAAIRIPDERGAELEPRAIHVAEPALGAAAGTILSRPQAISEPLARRVLDSRQPVILGLDRGGSAGGELLEPFLVKGSTAAVLPLATPEEAIGTLTLLSLDPARPLDSETVETALAVSAQAALAIDNARLYQQQKDFAETMQRSLLPSEPPMTAGLDIGHVYQSAARVDVGGDVYDFVTLEDGRLAVVLGDVTGKGIEAAADMAMAKYAFRSLARAYPEPGALLARVNDVVVEEIALGKFITMVVAIVDAAHGVVRIASAGHPPARLVTPHGSVSVLSAPGLALGVESGEAYGAEEFRIPRGSSLVLFTDGVIEARRDGELYGEERLDAFLAANATLRGEPLANALVEDCRRFSGGDLSDDCAVVVLSLAP